MTELESRIDAVLELLPAGATLSIEFTAQLLAGKRKNMNGRVDEPVIDELVAEVKLAQRIRNERRAIMPDAGRGVSRPGAKYGKMCVCGERVGPRTKECMCGHKFPTA